MFELSSRYFNLFLSLFLSLDILSCDKLISPCLLVSPLFSTHVIYILCNFFCQGVKCESKLECPLKDCDTTKCDPSCKQPGCVYNCPEEDPFKNCVSLECTRSSNVTCRQKCNNQDCLFDGGHCLPKLPRCEYEKLCQKLYKNGQCNEFCNKQECGYDIDCFEEPHLVKTFSSGMDF